MKKEKFIWNSLDYERQIRKLFDIIRENNQQRYDIMSPPIKPGETNTKVINLLIYYYECYINENEAEKLQ
jgi:hypothetical protein